MPCFDDSQTKHNKIVQEGVTEEMEMHTVSTESFLRSEGGADAEHESHHDGENHHESGTADRDAPPYQPEEILPPYEHRNNADRLRSTPLHRNWWMLIPTAIYAAMAVYSWVYFCLLSRTGNLVTDKHHRIANEYKAARVLQLIVAVATVPMISAVCAWAAAVYVQNQPDAYSLRLRQVAMLADRSWINPLTFLTLVFAKSGFKRYGSIFLYLAMFTSLFGVITYPVQSLFLLSTHEVYVQPLDRWGYVYYNPASASVATVPYMVSSDGFAAGTSILSLRRELQTNGVDGQYPQIWGSTDSLSSIPSTMNETWFATLPNTFTTGPYGGQYLPRVNSSTTIQNLTAGEFPSDCAGNPDWFYALYTYPYPVSQWNATVEVCLAVNTTTSIWNATNDRQDFSEVLYLNATNKNNNYELGAVKIIMNTTAGLFELPSLENDNQAGPLESNSSVQCAGYPTSCKGQARVRRQVWDYFQPALLGPLSVISLALFGPGSWADLQQNATASYSSYENETGWTQYMNEYMVQENIIPLQPLGLQIENSAYTDIERLLGGLTYFEELSYFDTAESLTRASILATKSIFDTYGDSWETAIQYTTSTLTQMTLPTLSSGGLILGSVLLGLYLIPLLGMAVYAAMIPRWTVSLNAFTLLRMGAALGQKELPLLIGFRTRKITALDDLPGVVRDISGPDDSIRQLALGVEGGKPLQANKRYLAYPGNNDLFAAGNPNGRRNYR